jgi:hypothetical protein
MQPPTKNTDITRNSVKKKKEYALSLVLEIPNGKIHLYVTLLHAIEFGCLGKYD